MTDRIRIEQGSRVLLTSGPALVVAVGAKEVTIRLPDDSVAAVPTADLYQEIDGKPVARGLGPAWSALPPDERDITLERLAIVLEITTGYRSGFAALAEPDEPRLGFGSSTRTITSRCRTMAELLSTRSGGGPKRSTIERWVRLHREQGLLGLIDRRRRPRRMEPDLDPRFLDALVQVLGSLDGDRSTVSTDELLRRAKVAFREECGHLEFGSQRAARAAADDHLRRVGSTPQAQRSTLLRGISGKRHFLALRPGQVLAVDATRSDVLVRDPVTGEAHSVEFLTAIDVATRAVVAFRVAPKSADAVDVALLLYDAMRPMSLTVRGDEISQLRWPGIPEVITFHDPDPLPREEDGMVRPPTGSMEGTHHLPAVMPIALRSDHGSIFLAHTTRDVLSRWGIDLMLTRGSRPTDNPHVERWHKTLQRALQQLPGYKGPNTSKRGRKVESEDLLTPDELRDHMHRFICLDYHQTPHDGLGVPGHAGLRITPLEMFDALMEESGRIDLPADPQLLYDFLPVRWGKIRHDGVEFTNLTYDSTALDDFRALPNGAFRATDASAPFYYDRHDVSRVWFRNPDTGLVSEIPWRGAARLQAPLTDKTLRLVLRRLRKRGGNSALSRDGAQDRILEQLVELTRSRDRYERQVTFAARMRTASSRQDHAEAMPPPVSPVTGRSQDESTHDLMADLLSPWPDYRE